MELHRTTLSEVLHKLPQLEDLNHHEHFDLVIACSGFEPRTVAVARHLAEGGTSARTCVYLTYSTNPEENEGQRGDLIEQLSRLSSSVHPLLADTDDPAFLRDFYDHLKAEESDRAVRVLFDISGASGRLILRVLRALFDAEDDVAHVDLTISYAQALEYLPDQATADATIAALKNPDLDNSGSDATLRTLGLDFDADSKVLGIEHPGEHLETLADRAVIICGFNHDRLRAALDHIDPSFNTEHPHPQATFIVGLPPAPELRWRYEAMLGINGLDDPEARIDLHDASTLDYTDLLTKLEIIYDQTMLEHERMTIVPFGSKLQSVAAAMFLEMHRDVRVVLAMPRNYSTTGYSHGVGELTQLALGPLHAVRDTLLSVGTLSITGSPLTGKGSTGSAPAGI